MIEGKLAGASYIFTGREEGDLGRATEQGLEPRFVEARRKLVDKPWRWVHQVHDETDFLVTDEPKVVLSISVADCGALMLSSAYGVIGAAHVGWRGLLSGVVEQTVEEMRKLGAHSIDAALGPCIAADSYEFGDAELDEVAALYGDEVRAVTTGGMPALDLRAGIKAALVGVDVKLEYCSEIDTAASDDYFSHRVGQDAERQVGAIWRD